MRSVGQLMSLHLVQILIIGRWDGTHCRAWEKGREAERENERENNTSCHQGCRISPETSMCWPCLSASERCDRFRRQTNIAPAMVNERRDLVDLPVRTTGRDNPPREHNGSRRVNLTGGEHLLRTISLTSAAIVMRTDQPFARSSHAMLDETHCLDFFKINPANRFLC